jgi:hypothetical protein
LADGVWGNETMAKAAQEFAADHKELRPLVVHVDEHAGWFLSYLFGAPNIADGTICRCAECRTANDAAHLSEEVLTFERTITEIENLYGTSVYDGDCVCPVCRE